MEKSTFLLYEIEILLKKINLGSDYAKMSEVYETQFLKTFCSIYFIIIDIKKHGYKKRPFQ